MFSYLVLLVSLTTVSALHPPSLDHSIITPQQLEWNGIYLPDLSCDPQACCCFTTAFQLIIGMNEQNETLIYIHGGNMAGSVNGSPCDFANTPLALPSESTPHIISKQVMDGSVLTHWYLNDNATALMVINGLQNPSVGSTCSFKATRQPDETSLSTPNAIDYTLFPYFPCGFQPCSQVPIQPYIQEWIGSYQPSNQIICDSTNPSCICFQRDISMSLTMGMDGSYNGMSLGGQYFNGQEWIHYQDEMILPSHSYTVPTEWHHMHYIFSLSANDTWIHLNAINQDISTCSFTLVRPRTDGFSSITPHPKATTSTPEPTIRHQYSSYNYISTTGLSINSSSFISPSMIYIFIGLFVLQYFS